MKKNNWFLIIALIGFSCSAPSEESQKKKSESKNDTASTEQHQKVTVQKEALNIKLLKSGDVIFQTLADNSSSLISIATQSPFSHCGIIIKEQENLLVLEAFGEVKKTPLSQWIEQGQDQKMIVMRLKNYDQFIHKGTIKKAQEFIQANLKKSYDSKFKWSDDEIYCSELVWKLFKSALDIELCPIKKLSEYELSSPEVQAELKNKYGNQIPMGELMVAPGDLAASDYLEMIYSNY